MKLKKQEQETLAKLLKLSVSGKESDQKQARQMFAKALEIPLRMGCFDGPLLFDIFEEVPVGPDDCTPYFPLDFVEPGTECDYAAYTIPDCGAIPYCHVEGDEIKIPIYDVGNCIDTCIKYIKYARWDVVSRMLEAFKSGFIMKLNRDGWRTILTAATDRNVIISDAQADKGQFTKRLLNLMTTFMMRNGGGNSMSNCLHQLTDLYISPEAMMEIRCWNTDQIDELTRREIYQNNGMLSRLYGVNLHVLHELGVGQEFQQYLLNDLGVPLSDASGRDDAEFVVGLCQSRTNTFIMPTGGPLEVYEDDNLHRSRRWGLYGWLRVGFGILDGRSTVLGSF